jgi:hypothetical protein
MMTVYVGMLAMGAPMVVVVLHFGVPLNGDSRFL